MISSKINQQTQTNATTYVFVEVDGVRFDLELSDVELGDLVVAVLVLLFDEQVGVCNNLLGLVLFSEVPTR
jgi:hypothetical protein